VHSYSAQIGLAVALIDRMKRLFIEDSSNSSDSNSNSDSRRNRGDIIAAVKIAASSFILMQITARAKAANGFIKQRHRATTSMSINLFLIYCSNRQTAAVLKI
jgi:hypothetical protein